MNAVLGDLPTWNLADLYSSPTGPDLERDLKRAAADAEKFAGNYEGRIAGLDGKFSIAGRSQEGMLQLVFVVEYFDKSKPFCSQSWNIAGIRRADEPKAGK